MRKLSHYIYIIVCTAFVLAVSLRITFLVIRSIILALFPSLILSDIMYVIFSAVILLIIALFFLWLRYSNSYFVEIITKIIIKIVAGIVLLLIAFFIYPSGIMDTTLASLTLGDLLRLLIVMMLLIAFLVDFFFLIPDIFELREYYHNSRSRNAIK
jgi:ABC-type amino acid transport system permease subunit